MFRLKQDEKFNNQKSQPTIIKLAIKFTKQPPNNNQTKMGPYLAQPNKQKKTQRLDNLKNKLKFSSCEMQGWRRNMQDSCICELDIGNGNALFGVFDGHGGPQVSKYVERIFVQQLTTNKLYKEQKYKEAMVETFRRVDQMVASKEGEEQLTLLRKNFDGASSSSINAKISTNCGCTANVVLITPTKIITANAGDSRSILCRKGTSFPLSHDHKPQNPQQHKRITSAKGSIINGRVNGGLNLSRSLGDFNYKQDPTLKWDEQLISGKPDVTEFDRSPGQDQFIIMGCDGIWERFVKDSQPLVTRIVNEKKASIDGVNILKGLFDFLLAGDTSEETGCDNMTAVLIEFV